MTRGRLLVVGVLVLLAVAAAPLLGWWTLGVAVVLLALASATYGRARVWTGTAPVLGGAVAGVSALVALLHRAGDPAYGGRAVFGWAALALALVAAAGGGLAPTRPGLAAAPLLLGSLLGFVAINLFDIDTFYFVAMPLCWLAAALALTRPAPAADAPG